MHIDQFPSNECLVPIEPKVDPEIGMTTLHAKKNEDIETGAEDDHFIDSEDDHQVAQNWFENCDTIEKEEKVSGDWSDDLSFFSCGFVIEEIDHEELQLISLHFANSLCHLQSSVACSKIAPVHFSWWITTV